MGGEGGGIATYGTSGRRKRKWKGVQEGLGGKEGRREGGRGARTYRKVSCTVLVRPLDVEGAADGEEGEISALPFLPYVELDAVHVKHVLLFEMHQEEHVHPVGR